MRKGTDYTGVCVAFYCHDGKGNYLFHKRTDTCRDEHGKWDCGGGGLHFNENLLDGVWREISEEFDTEPLEIEFMGYGEAFREHDGAPTHWITFRYRVLVDREKIVNNEPDKHVEIGWFAMDNLPNPLHSMVLKELEEYKDKLV